MNMSKHFCRKALVVALGIVIGGAASGATRDAVLANTVIVTHATPLTTGDRVVRPLALTRPMKITLLLKLRNQAELNAFIAQPRHKNLTPAEFRSKFAPTDAQVVAVKLFLHHQGFTNVEAAPNGLLVTAEAPASTVQRAFHTSLVNVLTRTGRMAFANATAARIPKSLRGTVHEVLGLQSVHQLHVVDGLHINASGTRQGHNPLDLATIYGVGNSPTGASVNVGVITVGNMATTVGDFKIFLQRYPSLGKIPVHVVTVNGGNDKSVVQTEWSMDTQAIAALSGGVKNMYLYATSDLSDQAILLAFNKAVADDLARVISASIAACELYMPGKEGALGDDIFKEAIAQGQTFSIASGDAGAKQCGGDRTSVSWPANSQYVVSVGGTTLYTSGTTWTGETVWNNYEGATGGGPSNLEPMPSWQKDVGQNAGHTTRGVPDVSYTGNPKTGMTVIINGRAGGVIGGTSLAAPMFAGVWARVLAAHPEFGFAGPLIYQDAASHYATDFHDVIAGDNRGYSAHSGWDYASGLGSIRIANFISHVASGSTPPPPPPPPPSGNKPPVADFTSSVSGMLAGFKNTSSDSDGEISWISWHFGDDGTSTGWNPRHVYQTPGTYTVSLTVTDNGGARNTKTSKVQVAADPENKPPVARFSDSTSGLTVSFNNTSTDSDGTIAGVSWHFGDGSTAVGWSPKHTYRAEDTYTVSLNIYDNEGAPSTAIRNVTVGDAGSQSAEETSAPANPASAGEQLGD